MHEGITTHCIVCGNIYDIDNECRLTKKLWHGILGFFKRNIRYICGKLY